MNRFQKIYSPWLILPGLAIIIVILAFIFRPESAAYKLNAGQSLKLMNDNSLQVSIQDLAGKQLIDVRTSELYSQGHPADAINVPVRQLLDKKSLELFENLMHKGKEAVLYGTDELQVTAPLFLLRQMGYKNLRLLIGEFTAINGFREPEPASAEFSVISSAGFRVKLDNPSAEKVQKPKSETLIPVRKKTSSGGGC